MKARDLAYLCALIDLVDSPYPRKEQVRSILQRSWKIASTAKTKQIQINVTTSWEEDRAKEQAAEAKNKKDFRHG